MLSGSWWSTLLRDVGARRRRRRARRCWGCGRSAGSCCSRSRPGCGGRREDDCSSPQVDLVLVDLARRRAARARRWLLPVAGADDAVGEIAGAAVRPTSTSLAVKSVSARGRRRAEVDRTGPVTSSVLAERRRRVDEHVGAGLDAALVEAPPRLRRSSSRAAARGRHGIARVVDISGRAAPRRAARSRARRRRRACWHAAAAEEERASSVVRASGHSCSSRQRSRPSRRSAPAARSTIAVVDALAASGRTSAVAVVVDLGCRRCRARRRSRPRRPGGEPGDAVRPRADQEPLAARARPSRHGSHPAKLRACRRGRCRTSRRCAAPGRSSRRSVLDRPVDCQYPSSSGWSSHSKQYGRDSASTGWSRSGKRAKRPGRSSIAATSSATRPASTVPASAAFGAASSARNRSARLRLKPSSNAPPR